MGGGLTLPRLRDPQVAEGHLCATGAVGGNGGLRQWLGLLDFDEAFLMQLLACAGTLACGVERGSLQDFSVAETSEVLV